MNANFSFAGLNLNTYFQKKTPD